MTSTLTHTTNRMTSNTKTSAAVAPCSPSHSAAAIATSGAPASPSSTGVMTSPASAAPINPWPYPGTLPPVHQRTPTHIKIDERWYDLSTWKYSHPGGNVIIEHMDGQDATDAFYSLHGDDAIARLKRLPSTTSTPSRFASRPPLATSAATLAFREFRADLVAKGFFKRDLKWELFYTLFVYGGMVLGSLFAYSGYSVLAILTLGLTMQQAGWIGHDYTHARGDGCYYNGFTLSVLSNAFSRAWWSNKHNTHHVYTNYIGIDADIENDPVFHLFFPSEENDVFARKMQHWYFVPVASVLYISWKIQSLQYALLHRNRAELALMVIHYAWLYSLGFWVSILSVYLAGGLVAVIVTATHQSEEMIDTETHATVVESTTTATTPSSTSQPTAIIPYSFVESQFSTTRDVRTNNFLAEFVWGGMQYQLEHHLFPTMPKYKLALVAPLVQAFAQKNGLDYRCDTQVQIWKRNFATLRYYAQKCDPKKADKSKESRIEQGKAAAAVVAAQAIANGKRKAW